MVPAPYFPCGSVSVSPLHGLDGPLPPSSVIRYTLPYKWEEQNPKYLSLSYTAPLLPQEALEESPLPSWHSGESLSPLPQHVSFALSSPLGESRALVLHKDLDQVKYEYKMAFQFVFSSASAGPPQIFIFHPFKHSKRLPSLSGQFPVPEAPSRLTKHFDLSARPVPAQLWPMSPGTGQI